MILTITVIVRKKDKKDNERGFESFSVCWAVSDNAGERIEQIERFSQDWVNHIMAAKTHSVLVSVSLMLTPT